MKVSFRTETDRETAILERSNYYKQLHEQAGWNDILAEHPKYQIGTREWQHGVDMHNADVQNYDKFKNLQELEAYTVGTSTFIELQKSVHNSISELEYDILNSINIIQYINTFNNRYTFIIVIRHNGIFCFINVIT